MAKIGTMIALAKALGTPNNTQVNSAVSAWLAAHPEATTTVQDGAITRAKLDNDLQAATDAVPGLVSSMNGVIPAEYPYTYYEGKYVYWANGTKANAANFSVTNFIPLNGAKKIVYTRLKVESSAPNHGIAFFTTNETAGYISGIKSKPGASEAGYELYEADVPATANYVQITWVNQNRRENEGFGDLHLYDATQYHASLAVEGKVTGVALGGAFKCRDPIV